jgi:hypothetical protein
MTAVTIDKKKTLILYGFILNTTIEDIFKPLKAKNIVTLSFFRARKERAILRMIEFVELCILKIV